VATDAIVPAAAEIGAAVAGLRTGSARALPAVRELEDGGAVAPGSRSFDSDLLQLLLGASADRLRSRGRGAERNVRSPDLGDHHERVVSGDDTRGHRVVV
jgi:hypothetical protein